jgi:serine/threonine protein kinase
MVGRRLGHYEIITELGAGAVGVVYKARDLRLGRIVALKCILPQLVANPDVRRRFEREAKAAARIEHPNVCTIYEIGRDDETDFLVVAYVDGPSLAELLRKGPLKLDQSLEIVEQVASGLQAAHECGVVHRDVKPANILLAQGREVKLTDFGLAQVADASRITTGDTVLGTPAYMSPEQVWGKDTDRRTDTWSVGVTLYEMVAGSRPFAGDWSEVVRYAILNEEPPPISSLRPGVPTELSRIVSKALRKDRGERYQHADEMIADLKQLRRSLHEPAERAQTEQRSSAAAEPRRLPRFAIAGLGFACVVLGLWIGQRFPRASEPADQASTQFLKLTDTAGVYRHPAISPDSRYVAFSSDRAGATGQDIWLQHLADGQTLRLTSSPGDEDDPSFSPDGSRLAYHADGPNQGLFLVSILGGNPLPLVQPGRGPRFHPAADRIVFWAPSGGESHFGSVSTLSVDGAAQHPVDFGFPVAHPIWSPDGSWILASGARSADEDDDWWVLPDGAASSPQRLGIAGMAGARHLAKASKHPCWRPAAWTSEGLLFVASLAGADSLWLAHITKALHIESLERLTNGPGNQVDPAAAKGTAREVVFVHSPSADEFLNPADSSVWLLKR